MTISTCLCKTDLQNSILTAGIEQMYSAQSMISTSLFTSTWKKNDPFHEPKSHILLIYHHGNNQIVGEYNIIYSFLFMYHKICKK